VDDAAPLLRVVVAEAEADLVRARTRAVSARFVRERDTTRPAALVREVPGGATLLPSRAFSSEAGGPFPLDPADPERLRTLGVVFQFDVAVTDPLAVAMVGERAWVRFDHGTEPVAWRLWRAARQLFLSRFNV
jgi:putative peptide zinc metalloprotease protein